MLLCKNNDEGMYLDGFDTEENYSIENWLDDSLEDDDVEVDFTVGSLQEILDEVGISIAEDILPEEEQVNENGEHLAVDCSQFDIIDTIPIQVSMLNMQTKEFAEREGVDSETGKKYGIHEGEMHVGVYQTAHGVITKVTEDFSIVPEFYDQYKCKVVLLVDEYHAPDESPMTYMRSKKEIARYLLSNYQDEDYAGIGEMVFDLEDKKSFLIHNTSKSVVENDGDYLVGHIEKSAF